jgi:hypothetical protein
MSNKSPLLVTFYSHSQARHLISIPPIVTMLSTISVQITTNELHLLQSCGMLFWRRFIMFIWLKMVIKLKVVRLRGSCIDIWFSLHNFAVDVVINACVARKHPAWAIYYWDIAPYSNTISSVEHQDDAYIGQTGRHCHRQRSVDLLLPLRGMRKHHNRASSTKVLTCILSNL